MTKFLIRVILHDSDSIAAYDTLNGAMLQLGFLREMQGAKASYHLPHGTYFYRGDAVAKDLRLMASTAAQSTGHNFGVIVTRAAGGLVMGLKRSGPTSRRRIDVTTN